jgi:hypothetical protein
MTRERARPVHAAGLAQTSSRTASTRTG